MTAYDDDRVIALLKESVPAPPDSPVRVDSVRRLASRQRSYAGIQALGVAASVLLVVGAAAAIARPGGTPGPVRPASNPIATMTAAFDSERSARVDVTSRIEGAPTEQADTRMTGVVLRNGNLELRGVPPVPTEAAGNVEPMTIRFVEGVMYRSVMPHENAPAGKKWVRMKPLSSNAPEVKRFIGSVGKGLSDVRYVRASSVRGTPVAEYHGTAVAAEALGLDEPISVTFSLDEKGRPRRFAMSSPFGKRAEALGLPADATYELAYELYDYGVAATIVGPPASEVIDEDDLDRPGQAVLPAAQVALKSCARGAQSQAALDACLRAYERTMAPQRTVTCTGGYPGSGDWVYQCSDGAGGSSREASSSVSGFAVSHG